jgi:tripartite-type tricarboxylate transporter receptor subunit TctC
MVDRIGVLLAGMLALGGASTLCAQQPAFPAKPVRLVIPYPAGGAADLLARTLGQKLAERWGQQLVIDNRPGANTIIGMEAVARAAPDGHTLIMATTAMAINPSLYEKLPFDTRRDFAPVGNLVFASFLLLTHPSVPVRDVKGLIALARARPGELTFGSGSTGSPTHLSGELLKVLAGVDMVHVPYKGIAPAIADLIGGQLSMLFADPLPTMPHVKSGKLRGLAVSSLHRFPAAPDIPTLDESGLKGYESGLWYGILAPAGTPAPVIEKLNGDFVRALGLPDVRERLTGIGTAIIGDTPAQFATTIAADLAKWRDAIKRSAIPPLAR